MGPVTTLSESRGEKSLLLASQGHITGQPPSRPGPSGHLLLGRCGGTAGRPGEHGLPDGSGLVSSSSQREPGAPVLLGHVTLLAHQELGAGLVLPKSF